MLTLMMASALVTPVFSTVTPAGAVETWTRPKANVGSTYRPNRVLVRFKDGANSSAVEKLTDKYDMSENTVLDDTETQLFELGDGQNPASVATNLRRDPNVLLAEPDYELQPTGITNETRIGELWRLKNSGQAIQGQYGTIDVDLDASDSSDESI